MAKKMLVDATHSEETRVVVLDGHRLEEFDFETSAKKQLKGNIYLAKVTRVEPSLQAAFVEYGGNRHGFLAFSEIHPDYYRIPIADREALLAAQEAEAVEAEALEERGRGNGGGNGGGRRRGREKRRRSVEGPSEALGEGTEERADAAPDDGSDHLAAEGGRAESGDVGAEGDGWSRPVPDEDGRHEASGDADRADRDRADRDRDDADAGDRPHDGDTGGDHHPDRGRENGGENGGGETGGGVETLGGDEVEEEARVRRAPPRNYRNYKIQEVIKRRQIMLVQVTKEERGNKGAALTTYLSLAGRYCVLMPNTPRGGGISRKIQNPKDRKKMKAIMDELEVPEGMAVILRTAGLERTRQEIRRDLDYLLRLWDSIRETTLQSTAPTLIHEEANLIKRAIRDLYSKDIDEVVVSGEEGYRTAKDFMRMLMPSHAKKVQLYRDETVPLFHRNQVEGQIDAMHSPVVQLKSGGYIVINPTEALVSIDVNSGRATRERHIEETAYKTNLEAADEVARQLRLRDLAGLIVIDFIDMEEDRHNAAVERRLKEAMRQDRARIQIGRISAFGLLELSRQRLRPSLLETHFETCAHCGGIGMTRTTGSGALSVLRAIEEEGIKRRAAEITVYVATSLALYLLNQKRDAIADIEKRYGLHVMVERDDTLMPPALRIDRTRIRAADAPGLPAVDSSRLMAETDAAFAEDELEAEQEDTAEEADEAAEAPPRAEGRADQAGARAVEREAERSEERSGERSGEEQREGGRKRRRRRRRRGGEGRTDEARTEETRSGEARGAEDDGDGDGDEDRRAELHDDEARTGAPAPEAEDIAPAAARSEDAEATFGGELDIRSDEREPDAREAPAEPEILRSETGLAGEDEGEKRRRRGRRGGRGRGRADEATPEGAAAADAGAPEPPLPTEPAVVVVAAAAADTPAAAAPVTTEPEAEPSDGAAETVAPAPPETAAPEAEATTAPPAKPRAPRRRKKAEAPPPAEEAAEVADAAAEPAAKPTKAPRTRKAPTRSRRAAAEAEPAPAAVTTEAARPEAHADAPASESPAPESREAESPGADATPAGSGQATPMPEAAPAAEPETAPASAAAPEAEAETAAPRRGWWRRG